MQSDISCSLVIATYNWPEALELVLQSILKQSVLPLEVLIADDGSKEETATLIKKYQSIFSIPLKHFWHEDDGFRKTIILNETYRNALGNYIVQIDGDIILNKHFIEDHINNAKIGYFIKGSRGRLTKERTELLFQTKNINLNFLSKGLKSRINASRLPFLSFLFWGSPNNSRNIKGCNFAVWKKDFIAVNGYNNDLIGWGHEDIELGERLINSGVKKKQLKLVAVCFHIYHNEYSRHNESNNLTIYLNAVKQKISACRNGYQKL